LWMHVHEQLGERESERDRQRHKTIKENFKNL
jgi:hypothetical protein